MAGDTLQAQIKFRRMKKNSRQYEQATSSIELLSLTPHCLLPTAFPSEAVDEVEHDDGDERDDDGEH